MKTKVAVVGSRSFKNYNFLSEQLTEIFKKLSYEDVIIVSGGSGGADTLAEQYANENGLDTRIIKADWKDMSEPCVVKRNTYGTYNALAGFKRNKVVVDEADLIIAFWDGRSHGTADMIAAAKNEGKHLMVIDTNKI